ncbi:MAG: hypothetical protein EPO08_05355 [Rhodospirillaceae bacterium]|nr:MAG: hypothetical protein EPO08_05355 [Rhodospirillaceae bacterium]
MDGEKRPYTYEEGLGEFYRGEIVGEAIYSGLVECAKDPLERLKLAHLLQLETETKAWLRPHMIAAGVSVAEPAASRDPAIGFVNRLGALSWSEKVQFIADIVPGQVTQYRAYADAARARGNAAQAAVCDFMVEHELAQAEFARHELAGAEPAVSLAPLLRHSCNPLPTCV